MFQWLMFLSACSLISAQQPIWPLPQNYSSGDSTVTLNSNFKIMSTPSFPDIIHAISRYNTLIFPHKNVGQGSLSQLSITTLDDNVPLQLYVDESYILNIPVSGDAKLKANTYWGALRGLETFSQLVFYNYMTKSYEIRSAPWIIQDAPRFPHRGVLLDTSRHFEPIRTLKTFIDSMVYAKFNTFHWHMVDIQSFPFESKKYPLIWNGAFSEFERYTQEDVTELVEYARTRGIRVIAELDLPGHADSWCKGYPDICPSLTCTDPIDPSQPLTWDVITGLLSEITGGASTLGLFPDNYIHLGGDEVDTSCWTETPRIQQWMAENNFTAKQAYMYVVERAHQIVLAQGRQPINWEEVFSNFGSKLDNSTIVHIWISDKNLVKAVEAGYRVILSNNWYLGRLTDEWTAMYMIEPVMNITDPAQQSLVLGGEVCQWGETVDASDVFNTVWPRAAAVAERLWSAREVADTSAALPRLEYFRCLLNQRGIGAAPVNNPSARQAPSGPGSCFGQ